MGGVTGIELGPDACVLVRTGHRGSRTTVAGARVVVPLARAEERDGFAAALRQARRAQDLPRRARVVAWGTSAPQSAMDVAQLSDLTPVLNAGFEIDAILTPSDALAEVVRARVETASAAVAAVVVNRRGAVIAIVHRNELIRSRSFDWPLGPALRVHRPELLERYLWVAQLAPELQHLIDLARPVHAARVGSVVLCGTLPNLRSVAMLLVEELDIEVETLDSTDLLEPNLEPFRESVPALQLAAAAATVHVTGTFPRRLAGAAREARVLTLVGAGLATAWASLQLVGIGPATPVFSTQEVAALAIQKPVSEAPAVPDLRMEATIGRIGSGPGSGGSSDTVKGQEPSPAVARDSGRETAATAAPTPPPAPVGLPVESLVLPPLPRVDGIMLSGNRSLAIVDGNVVAPGDRVGPRRVLRIEREGVALQEPSGREVFVAIRTRKPARAGTERPA